MAPDLNGDGKPDVVFGHIDASGGSFNNNYVTVGLNRGDGTFAITDYVASPGPGPSAIRADGDGEPHSVAVGDFNGDGVPDLVVGSTENNVGPGGLSLVPGNPKAPGTFQSPRRYADNLGEVPRAW